MRVGIEEVQGSLASRILTNRRQECIQNVQ